MIDFVLRATPRGEISERKNNRRRIHRSPTENYPARLPFRFVTRLRYAETRMVNIVKAYVERNKLQLQLIRYCKNGDFSYVYFCEGTVSCNIVHRVGTEIYQPSSITLISERL